jgi:hypothetical protein
MLAITFKLKKADTFSNVSALILINLFFTNLKEPN